LAHSSTLVEIFVGEDLRSWFDFSGEDLVGKNCLGGSVGQSDQFSKALSSAASIRVRRRTTAAELRPRPTSIAIERLSWLACRSLALCSGPH
jgi:hypothetical protein